MRYRTPSRCACCKRPLDGLRAYEMVTTPCSVSLHRNLWKADAIPLDEENFRTEGFLCERCMNQLRDIMREE